MSPIFRRRAITPAEKLTGSVLRSIRKALPGEPIPVIVRFRERARFRVARDVVTGVGLVYAYTLVPAFAADATAEAINRLAADPDVETIWLDLPVHTCLDVSVPLLGVPKAWAAGFQGKGVVVGIVDTGVDAAHPDLAGRVSAVQDFTGQGSGDRNGHGTHVCGIVAGSGVASGGKFVGVAPEATLLVAKALRADGAGMTSDVIAGLEWAVDRQARVVNLSLGSTGPCDGADALSFACDAAWQRGAVVCVAAGNEGPGASTVGSPGCARRVITVGASTDADAVATFSSRGPTLDGRQKPDLCFPGAGITSCRSSGTVMGSPVDEFYTRASGTSMATPHATGAVALMLQANPTLTPDQVKGKLMQTARNLGLEGNVQGAGRADVAAACGLSGSQPGSPPPGEPPPAEPPPGEPPPAQPPAQQPPVTPPAIGCLPAALRWLPAAARTLLGRKSSDSPAPRKDSSQTKSGDGQHTG